MTTKEKAKAIRQELKALGWNARKVSVRTDYYSMGSSIYITIRDGSVPKSKVQAIADQHERIYRDDATGEILSGGNLYIHVDYSTEALQDLRTKLLVELEAVTDNTVRPVAGGQYEAWRGPDGYGCDTIHIHRTGVDQSVVRCHADNPEIAARLLAEDMVEQAAGN